LVTVAAAVGVLVVFGGMGSLGSIELGIWSVLTAAAVVAADRGARVEGRRS
jgi:hypothetical protein